MSSASKISMRPSGTVCGRPRARRRRSSPSSMPPSASPWPIRRCRIASRKSARKSGRSSIKRPRRWPRNRRRNWPSGRRSSWNPASRRNEMGALDSLEPIEKASKDALVALQLDRLKATLHQAYERVPHYKKKLDAAGVHPRDLKELADLAKFPFTTKEDLRQNYPFGMFAVPSADIVRIHASSGTTGKPTVVGYTKTDIDTWSSLMARSIRAAGGRSADKIHVAYGYGLFTGGLGAHYGGESLGAAVIPVGGGFTERQVQLIRDFAPDIIMVTPSYMLAILDEFTRQGADPRSTNLKVGIFGAEPWGEGLRAEIESAFRIDACDIYGLSGGMGPGVAQEFAATKDRPPIWGDYLLAEIGNSRTGGR